MKHSQPETSSQSTKHSKTNSCNSLLFFPPLLVSAVCLSWHESSFSTYHCCVCPSSLRFPRLPVLDATGHRPPHPSAPAQHTAVLPARATPIRMTEREREWEQWGDQFGKVKSVHSMWCTGQCWVVVVVVYSARLLAQRGLSGKSIYTVVWIIEQNTVKDTEKSDDGKRKVCWVQCQCVYRFKYSNIRIFECTHP